MKFKLIQVFRGVAAMLVVMFHLGINSYDHLRYICFNNFFNFGLIGVDFFFVLSGFIITYIHFKDLKQPTRSGFIEFFRKRFVRIMPLYWFVAIITTIIYYLSTPDFMVKAGMKIDFDKATFIFLSQSYLLINTGVRGLLGVAWTLSYEFLFYIVFGLGIVLGYRPAKVIACTWVVLILIFFLNPHLHNPYTKFYFNIIILEFLLGCFIAYLVLNDYRLSFKFLIPLLFVLFYLMMSKLNVTGLGYLFQRSVYNVVMMGLFFAVLTYASIQLEYRFTALKLPAILVLIGDASFSIYLTHNVVLSALTGLYAKIYPHFIKSNFIDVVAVLIFIIAVAFGIFIHLVVEKNLLKFVNYRLFSAKIKKQVVN